MIHHKGLPPYPKLMAAPPLPSKKKSSMQSEAEVKLRFNYLVREWKKINLLQRGKSLANCDTFKMQSILDAIEELRRVLNYWGELKELD